MGRVSLSLISFFTFPFAFLFLFPCSCSITPPLSFNTKYKCSSDKQMNYLENLWFSFITSKSKGGTLGVGS